MSEAAQPGTTTTIPAGEIIGKCEDCGLVRERDLDVDFPHGSECQHCNSDVAVTKVLKEAQTVPNVVVAGQ